MNKEIKLISYGSDLKSEKQRVQAITGVLSGKTKLETINETIYKQRIVVEINHRHYLADIITDENKLIFA
jgi:hypothetical protein